MLGCSPDVVHYLKFKFCLQRSGGWLCHRHQEKGGRRNTDPVDRLNKGQRRPSRQIEFIFQFSDNPNMDVLDLSFLRRWV
jgi:hypothetical protein